MNKKIYNINLSEKKKKKKKKKKKTPRHFVTFYHLLQSFLSISI